MDKAFVKIGLARERESPENPGSLEKRAALIPTDIKKLVEYGCNVAVETGTGDGIGFSDSDYADAGANIETASEIYAHKDLLIKFKGPALEDIPLMKPGTTLFCMAHFHSFPDRANLLKKHRINVIAMEHIVEHPARTDDNTVLSRLTVDAFLEPYLNRNAITKQHIVIWGFDAHIMEAVRRISNHNPASLQLVQPDDQQPDNASICFYDSKIHKMPKSVEDGFNRMNCRVIDFQDCLAHHKQLMLDYYHTLHHPDEFGMRRIQCLHETGMAGARYGLKLLKEESNLRKGPKDATAVVLGYGNVGMGAVDECYRRGVGTVHILGQAHTGKGTIEKWLAQADLIVNGAEQPVELRGKNYLITNQHVKETLKRGAVLIDLIGGSATNRSPVEPVVECTYLTAPHFVQDDVWVSALWGWPMMGMMRETAIRYSGQIIDVLLYEEKLIKGLGHLTPGVQQALVCGPFYL